MVRIRGGRAIAKFVVDIGATVLLVALLIGSIMLVSGKSAPELLEVLRNVWRKISGKVSSATENL